MIVPLPKSQSKTFTGITRPLFLPTTSKALAPSIVFKFKSLSAHVHSGGVSKDCILLRNSVGTKA